MVRWLFEQYRRPAAFGRVSVRSQPEYLRALKRIEDLPTKIGARVGDLLLSSISARVVDKIYEALQPTRQARAPSQFVSRYRSTRLEDRAAALSKGAKKIPSKGCSRLAEATARKRQRALRPTLLPMH